MNRRHIALMVALATVFSCASAAGTPIYRLVDLGTLGGTYSDPEGINAAGQVVGSSGTKNNATQHAYLYSAGKMTDIGTLGGNIAIARAINVLGQIVGESYTTGGSFDHAFLYSSGKMTDLGTLGGASNNSYAEGINSAGQIVGQSFTPSRKQHAFLYSGGTMTDLGTLNGDFSEATAINDLGQVVGSTGGGTTFRAFLYSNGTMSSLGTLAGSSFAYAINASGQVVGSYYLSGNAGFSHAFSYASGRMSDLGTLGGPNSEAWGVNASGQIVGDADINSDSTHGFLYAHGTMLDLNSLLDNSGSGWTIGGARAINDNGWIAAGAFSSALGRTDAVLLIPVPEPTSVILLALGGSCFILTLPVIGRRSKPTATLGRAAYGVPSSKTGS